MGTVIRFIATLVASAILAVLLTDGTCRIFYVGITCGHNAGLGLALYFISAFIGVSFVWSWLKRPEPRPPTVPKCGRCGRDVTFDMAVCPHCGFKFGNVAP
jgi:hypothetical protein